MKRARSASDDATWAAEWWKMNETYDMGRDVSTASMDGP